MKKQFKFPDFIEAKGLVWKFWKRTTANWALYVKYGQDPNKIDYNKIDNRIEVNEEDFEAGRAKRYP